MMNRIVTAQMLLILALAVTASACSSSGGGRYSFEVSEQNGVVTAVTRNGPKYAGELFEYEFVRALNEDEEVPDSLLDSPAWFAVDEKGLFYLPHHHDKRIQVFDREGQYVRSFGREGDGPGEFRYPTLQFITGDTISIFDPPLPRRGLMSHDPSHGSRSGDGPTAGCGRSAAPNASASAYGSRTDRSRAPGLPSNGRTAAIRSTTAGWFSSPPVYIHAPEGSRAASLARPSG